MLAKIAGRLLVVRDTRQPMFFMEKKYFCLGQARLNRSVFICAALEYSAHVYLRLMGKYQLMRVEKICAKTHAILWNCAISHEKSVSFVMAFPRRWLCAQSRIIATLVRIFHFSSIDEFKKSRVS